MWRKQSKGFCGGLNKRIASAFVGFCVIGLLLVGCGGSNASTSAAPFAASSNGGSAASGSVPSSGQKAASSAQYGPQYLAKSLQVTMEVQNTRQSANDLQQWINLADPQATSDGTDYENVGSNQYNVTLTFLIDVSHYTQVEDYLRDYAGQRGNTLLSLHETVQDETNDYIDTQSTLSNLRAEQQRLLAFMNQAQNVDDAVSIEQQLAQIEGQIDDIEAHLDALKGQTTFYTVTIALQPVGSVPPPPTSSPWSVIPVWQGAWSAVVGIWHLLAALLVWLVAFSVYIVPAGIILWLVRKKVWRGNRLSRVMPAMMPSGPQPKDGDTD